MPASCTEVCDEVIKRLIDLGFDLGDDEDHQPIFDALEKVEFVCKTSSDRVTNSKAIAEWSDQELMNEYNWLANWIHQGHGATTRDFTLSNIIGIRLRNRGYEAEKQILWVWTKADRTDGAEKAYTDAMAGPAEYEED